MGEKEMGSAPSVLVCEEPEKQAEDADVPTQPNVPAVSYDVGDRVKVLAEGLHKGLDGTLLKLVSKSKRKWKVIKLGPSCQEWSYSENQFEPVEDETQSKTNPAVVKKKRAKIASAFLNLKPEVVATPAKPKQPKRSAAEIATRKFRKALLKGQREFAVLIEGDTPCFVVGVPVQGDSDLDEEKIPVNVRPIRCTKEHKREDKREFEFVSPRSVPIDDLKVATTKRILQIKIAMDHQKVQDETDVKARKQSLEKEWLKNKIKANQAETERAAAEKTARKNREALEIKNFKKKMDESRGKVGVVKEKPLIGGTSCAYEMFMNSEGVWVPRKK